MYLGAACITNIKGLWSLLGEQVEDLFSVGDSVGDSQVFVPAAELCTDIIQSNSLVAVTLQRQTRTETMIVRGCETREIHSGVCYVFVSTKYH